MKSHHALLTSTHSMGTTKKLSFKKKTKRYYGLDKVRTGAKLAWISVQNRHGWSLGLAHGKRTIWLRNVRFASEKEVERAIKSGIVFTHLAEK